MIKNESYFVRTRNHPFEWRDTCDSVAWSDHPLAKAEEIAEATSSTSAAVEPLHPERAQRSDATLSKYLDSSSELRGLNKVKTRSSNPEQPKNSV